MLTKEGIAKRIAQELKDTAKREEALQKLIDRELEEEYVLEEAYSIEDKAKNPMQAVLNK